MSKYYTSERNVQMLIALMKAHGIKKVIASPGTTNYCLVASLQQDSFFEMYSSVDERSAAYLACGLAAESGEAVALSCTGATASRNYLPGLTEAFYRKLPILAITSTQHLGNVGQNIAQVIDRSSQMPDVVKLSVQVPTVHDKEDEWACEVSLNKALLELFRHGGGPVHINLATTYCTDFSVKELPPTRIIRRINRQDTLPVISENVRIAIVVGAHKKWDDGLQQAVDNFCEAYNGAVICDHTSNYKGKYRVLSALVENQTQYYAACKSADIVIHIGDISGAYFYIRTSSVWRVNPDGEIRDTFRSLKYVFEMEEQEFFEKYVAEAKGKKIFNTYFEEWEQEYNKFYAKIPELPFSNIWVAQQTASRLPEASVLHLGILNSLRSWNFFEVPKSILGYANTGGFGIDGGVSSLIGASLADREKLYIGIVGDLAFFYDLNVLGNRHVGNNLRLLLINNGKGTEFRNYCHPAACFGEEADKYMAAGGHFGRQSADLVKHYSQDLGFEYLYATNKDEYMIALERFVKPELTDKPILLEVFTESEKESNALKTMHTLEANAVGTAKRLVKGVLGEKGVETLKKIIVK